MRAVPIPDHLVTDRTQRVVFGPPDGDPTGDVRPVEGLVGVVEDVPHLCFLLQLEDGELERLAETGAVWLTLITNQPPPFALHVADDGDYDLAGCQPCEVCNHPVPNLERHRQVIDATALDGPDRELAIEGHRECVEDHRW